MTSLRTDAELVFGLAYGVGTDPEPVLTALENYLRQYSYKAHVFRISEYLRALSLGIEFDDSSPSSLMNELMNAGNAARTKSGLDDILAVSAINSIVALRSTDESKQTRPSFNTAHVIRSLKRPEEVALLRQIYRPGFYLVGIAADDDEQCSYLMNQKGLTETQARALLDRDQEEHQLHGQRMRDTFYLADVFLELRESRYLRQLQRFLELIFGRPFITPSREEHAMFMAYASAARSAQIGRQVGSAIATPEGEVIAVGFNEVPSRHAGPYWEGDEEDWRDHRKGSDSNFEQRKKIVESIVKALKGRIVDEPTVAELLRVALKPAKSQDGKIEESITEILAELKSKQILTSRDDLRELIDGSELKGITEYGRAVHAEMDAILTCTRLGISTKNKHLYTTTFPCHNCTRHIIASGIRKVVYIEPYPKSKAKDLHSDAICFDEKEASQFEKIPFLPFVGIGPRRYLDLFSLQLTTGLPIDRKGHGGQPAHWDKAEHKGPCVAMEPYSYLERELKLLDERKAKLAELAQIGASSNG